MRYIAYKGMLHSSLSPASYFPTYTHLTASEGAVAVMVAGHGVGTRARVDHIAQVPFSFWVLLS
jgi:hypothetical protein